MAQEDGGPVLESAQDLDHNQIPALPDVTCLPVHLDGRMFHGMLTPKLAQQQLMSVEDLSTMLGLPQTPGSVSSPGLSNPWDAFFLPLGSPGPSDATSILSRKHSLGSDIPDERFTKLARLWPKKGPPQWTIMQTLWTDAACHKETNLFSNAPLRCHDNNENNDRNDRSDDNEGNDDDDSLPSSRSNALLRGFDDATRQSLIHFMHPDSGIVSHLRPPSFSPPFPDHPQENEHDFPRTSRFPTVDTLAVCIDHYFQRFHPLFPFIHEPTFSARQTPLIMLAPMCLIGLHLLNPASTRDFVANQLLVRTPLGKRPLSIRYSVTMTQNTDP